jgi:helix-turn-helix protein
MEIDRFMTSTEFAEKIKRPYNTVIRWLRQGKVPGAVSQPFGNINVWLIPRERVDDYQEWNPTKEQGKRGKAKANESSPKSVKSSKKKSSRKSQK